ncbi:hypothetical protein ACN28G_14800 [Micromonospora sp. WMMA1923]|uniref:hypothetical protein n=1 Tax=Micromonospora sp. WMMA1923 TaxID=3404125 RepID=UPI003B950CBD
MTAGPPHLVRPGPSASSAHGPEADTLAADLTSLLHQWDDADRPNRPTITAHRTGTRTARPGDITRPHTLLTTTF